MNAGDYFMIAFVLFAYAIGPLLTAWIVRKCDMIDPNH